MRLLIDAVKETGAFELSDTFCRNLIKAAPMHDLGKIAVEDAILRKPGRFTPEEFAVMKTHAPEGARIVHEILKDTDDDEFHILAENVAHYHHERWDGSGYPEGLKGEAIPLEARIMAVADVYDALVSKRVYKKKMSFEKADAILREGMGSQFDPALERRFIPWRPARNWRPIILRWNKKTTGIPVPHPGIPESFHFPLMREVFRFAQCFRHRAM